MSPRYAPKASKTCCAGTRTSRPRSTPDTRGWPATSPTRSAPHPRNRRKTPPTRNGMNTTLRGKPSPPSGSAWNTPSPSRNSGDPCNATSATANTSKTPCWRSRDSSPTAAPSGNPTSRTAQTTTSGHQSRTKSQDRRAVGRRLQDPVYPAVRVVGAAALDVHELLAQVHRHRAGLAAADRELTARPAHGADRRDHRRGTAGERLAQLPARGVGLPPGDRLRPLDHPQPLFPGQR